MEADPNKETYAVIIFQVNKMEYVSAIPKQWINEENSTCLWPKNKNIERKAINLNMKPEADWLKLENITIVGSYETLEEALNVEKKKTFSSSESEEMKTKENKRKKKMIKTFRDDSISPLPSLSYVDEMIQSSSDSTSTKSESSPPEKEPTNDIEIEIIESDSISINHASPGISPNDIFVDEEVSEDMGIVIGKSKYEILLQHVIDVKAMLKYTTYRIEAIEKKLNLTHIELNDKNVLPPLPLKEIVEIQDLENSLNSDEITRKQLLQLLKYTGGLTIKECVTRCLQKMFTNYLGQFCSWTGKKGNFKLRDLAVMNIIRSAVKENFPSLTDEQFEKIVMGWFQHATTRYKRNEINS